MASQLVDDVRALLRTRAEAGRPLTALERTFLLAAIAPRSNAASSDVVDELEAAIAEARVVLLSDPPRTADPTVVEARRKAAARRLIRAAREAIDFDPFHDYDPAAPVPAIAHGGRPERADVDG